ncbi:hypothetical protein BDK51DRAFT_51160 [Blyttiomyces helicus]|uniref:Uncharacterized protein n=1 Tax=Blyttiomyces helicus TaxID=388810 RepID=A0A4P9WP78_9FUNG|nr:hypothetical protein BDK51DRAFT_51160 [Blyttiomyces helicus]|eukprot:RKO94824.1 hypothetical protein BDK51DRAFT_51160 [Blyttiomyces helicus]
MSTNLRVARRVQWTARQGAGKFYYNFFIVSARFDLSSDFPNPAGCCPAPSGRQDAHNESKEEGAHALMRQVTTSQGGKRSCGVNDAPSVPSHRQDSDDESKEDGEPAQERQVTASRGRKRSNCGYTAPPVLSRRQVSDNESNEVKHQVGCSRLPRPKKANSHVGDARLPQFLLAVKNLTTPRRNKHPLRRSRLPRPKEASSHVVDSLLPWFPLNVETPKTCLRRNKHPHEHFKLRPLNVASSHVDESEVDLAPASTWKATLSQEAISLWTYRFQGSSSQTGLGQVVQVDQAPAQCWPIAASRGGNMDPSEVKESAYPTRLPVEGEVPPVPHGHPSDAHLHPASAERHMEVPTLVTKTPQHKASQRCWTEAQARGLPQGLQLWPLSRDWKSIKALLKRIYGTREPFTRCLEMFVIDPHQTMGQRVDSLNAVCQVAHDDTALDAFLLRVWIWRIGKHVPNDIIGTSEVAVYQVSPPSNKQKKVESTNAEDLLGGLKRNWTTVVKHLPLAPVMGQRQGLYKAEGKTPEKVEGKATTKAKGNTPAKAKVYESSDYREAYTGLLVDKHGNLLILDNLEGRMQHGVDSFQQIT